MGGAVSAEVGRDVTWPFIVGAIVTYLLLGVGLPAMLPASSKKDSKYLAMVEGRAFSHDEHHEESHH